MTDKRQTVKKGQIYVNAINLHYKTVNIGGKSKIESGMETFHLLLNYNINTKNNYKIINMVLQINRLFSS